MMLPVREMMEYMHELFPADITAFFLHVLTTTYLQWDGRFYEQTDGVAKGNPLSLVIAGIYMEKFEQTALQSTPCQPR